MLVLDPIDPQGPIPQFEVRPEDEEEMKALGVKGGIRDCVLRSARQSVELFVGRDDQTGEVLGVGGVAVYTKGDGVAVPWMLCARGLHTTSHRRRLLKLIRPLIATWLKKYPYTLMNVCLAKYQDTKSLVKHLGFEFAPAPLEGMMVFKIEPKDTEVYDV